MVNIVEYVWLGGENELRSKTRVLDFSNGDINIPKWNYDGSSTKQAEGSDSEVILYPHTVFRCPFRRNGNNYLVLCSTYKPNGQPIFNNHRHAAEMIFEQFTEEKPWYGLEQEYFLMDGDYPLGFPQEGGEQGQYYCSVGHENTYGREIVEEHLEACLYAGIQLSGINAEVAPGQWEFQVGAVEGILAADHLWMARYILQRISEKHSVSICYHPKPILGNWNGSGCHTNFSTKLMREGDNNHTGLYYIKLAIEKLGRKHDQHMSVYGADNNMRMTGAHETASYDKFTFGCANRGASIRIPNETVQNEKGYFEDRRPASNCDPYQVTSIICQTSCQNIIDSVPLLSI